MYNKPLRLILKAIKRGHVKSVEPAPFGDPNDIQFYLPGNIKVFTSRLDAVFVDPSFSGEYDYEPVCVFRFGTMRVLRALKRAGLINEIPKLTPEEPSPTAWDTLEETLK